MLNVVESGRGDRVALLLHGMTGSAESWWRVAPVLADHGYRVLALDLPGHGLSPRDPGCTVERAAASVIETVHALAPGLPVHAIGHSYGGMVLAAAAGQLRPELAVHVDAPLRIERGATREELIASYDESRRTRTVEGLRATRPYYSERDVLVEARAAERFDSVTAASVSSGGGEWVPEPGSIVVRADPSSFVSDADARALAARGVDVRSIPGAAHTVWYSHFDDFVTTVPEMFGAASGV